MKKVILAGMLAAFAALAVVTVSDGSQAQIHHVELGGWDGRVPH
ncbi:hypothetical protein [Streptomyces sp. NPDC101150]